jgi:hypothetical protein
MTWFLLLGLAALITAFAAVTGMKAKGTEHLAHTRMMGMARIILLIVIVLVGYLAFRASSHH